MKARGFTLLEVLVVTIITGMVAAVLMQSLATMLALRGNLAQKILGLEQAVLQRNLFIAPIQGLVPDYPERPNVFGGDEAHLHGLTVRSLQNRPGAPVGFDMYFEYDVNRSENKLMYQEKGRAPVVLGRWAGAVGRFTYRGQDGDWLTAWPPREAAADFLKPPQTPWLVRIEMGTGFPSTLIANIVGPHDRIIRLRDTPMGADIKP